MSMVIDDQHSTEKSETPAAISVSARIEYILRFNQQVVLVIDDEEQGYLNSGSEFLDGLPENHNAAYLSISNKFNDIQVRCRIIEQLFGDMPFDPETPLASCIINLLKDNNEHICIVLENAEYLSLQILHELCQLSEIAKKSDRTINIVLLGSIAAGKLVFNNPVLFKQKIALISGHSGQILSATDSVFIEKNRFFELTLAKKLAMLVLLLSVIAITIVYQLYQQDNFQFSALPEKPIEDPVVTSGKEDAILNVEDNVVTADVGDIYSALIMRESTVNNDDVVVESDIVEEISQESMVPTSNVADNEVEINQAISSNIVDNEEKNIESVLLSNKGIDINYFNRAETGDVIQFAAFPIGKQRENIKSYQKFKEKYPQLNLFAYYRLINKQAYIVITSEIFSSKKEAKQKLSEMPDELKLQGAWIKSLTAVKNEIQIFERETLSTNQ